MRGCLLQRLVRRVRAPQTCSLCSAAGPAEEVIVALGSNQGDRVALLRAAVRALPQVGVHVRAFSSLYETAPAYVTEQSPFLNAALSCTTTLEPLALLAALKRVEAQLGRTAGGQRFGPRPIDLDIIAYGSRRVDTPELTVPHPRLSERPFVLAPVADLAAGTTGPAAHIAQLWQRSGGESQVGRAGLARVLALPGGIVWPVGGRTRVMAVLNVTPDSFSDDGCTGVAQAVAAGLRLVEQGADVVDVGGQSTRPGAVRVSAEEEARRVLPVLRALREQLPPGVLLSVDTFYGSVASSAIAQGAHIVNDVSGGGRFDHTLLAAVADSDAAYVLMHSRGESDTMQRPEFTRYADVVKEVAVELRAAGERCVAAGIEPWRIVLDPGIGFAKDKDSNLQLLRNLPAVRPGAPGALRNAPLLVGPSRKGFLGSLAGGRPPAERDWATAAAVAACVAGGAELVRVHNVAAMRDVVAVADAIHRKLRDERRG